MTPVDTDIPPFARKINLASAKLGAKVIACSDQFFGKAERMLDDKDPVFLPDRYDDNGKWMDGWETRRRRGPGADFALIELPATGRMEGVEIDTRHFTGNYAPAASLALTADPDPQNANWTSLLNGVELTGNHRHFFALPAAPLARYARLTIHPDGGIARLRLFGTCSPPQTKNNGKPIEVSSLLAGADLLAWSDAHFGDPRRLIAPGPPTHMGDGWETRRRRGPGHDWILIRLGAPALIEKALIDTSFFKGNFPEKACLYGTLIKEDSELFHTRGEALIAASATWPMIAPAVGLAADTQTRLTLDRSAGPLTHLRFAIHPDGGVARLRLFGTFGSAGSTS